MTDDDDKPIDYRAILEKIRDKISANYIAYFLMAVALLACLYTMLNVAEYQQTCNRYWFEEIENKCVCTSVRSFNGSPTLYGTDIVIEVEEDKNG